jgi:hypothetical protein
MSLLIFVAAGTHASEPLPSKWSHSSQYGRTHWICPEHTEQMSSWDNFNSIGTHSSSGKATKLRAERPRYSCSIPGTGKKCFSYVRHPDCLLGPVKMIGAIPPFPIYLHVVIIVYPTLLSKEEAKNSIACRVWHESAVSLQITMYSYVCIYVRGVGLVRPSAPRPSLIYCASPLISPLLIPHFEWNVGLYLRGRHKSHLAP